MLPTSGYQLFKSRSHYLDEKAPRRAHDFPSQYVGNDLAVQKEEVDPF